jgi:cytochrome c oxidase assembly protein Cox11
MSALHQLSKHPQSNQAVPRPERQRVRKARHTPQQRQQQEQQQHRVIATEATLKLAMNVMISAVALVTLCNIIPSRTAQQGKLQEVQSEVKTTESRVSQLQTEFNRAFDSTQERQIAQEQTHFVDPNRTPIVWLDKKGRTAAQRPNQ